MGEDLRLRWMYVICDKDVNTGNGWIKLTAANIFTSLAHTQMQGSCLLGKSKYELILNWIFTEVMSKEIRK